ncbi:hypothetical protein K438DRAFT_230017 [Mycena galopus ATCC 62051]|nr:hypothetical protein K438DRAFT_230017 [Mycena galopus ATCC 62051]
MKLGRGSSSPLNVIAIHDTLRRSVDPLSIGSGHLIVAGGSYTSIVETEHSAEIALRSNAGSYAGAFFPRAQNFVVNGGIFTSNVTNNIHHAAPTLPDDFRRIPWGDIDLRSEIRLASESGVATRHPQRVFVRRVYSAKIEGREAGMTVAVYEGDKAEDWWQQSIATHSGLRHPHVLQIFATASSSGIHAIVAHGDLIPYKHYLELHRHLPVFSVYINTRADADYHNACVYFQDTSNQRTSWDAWDDLTVWMRRSTGRLCLELAAGEWPGEIHPTSGGFEKLIENPNSLDDMTKESKAIASFELAQYHELCEYLWKQRHIKLVAKDTELALGAVICGESLEDGEWVEIASMTAPPFLYNRLNTWPYKLAFRQNEWTGYMAQDITLYEVSLESKQVWFSQANYIFDRQQITTNYGNYELVEFIRFCLRISESVHNDPPAGYLPAYWSLDPCGAQSLSTEEATHLGFPSLEFSTEVIFGSYVDDLYTRLRTIHEAKGFDPETQDVARHLGEPLYQISNVRRPCLFIPWPQPTDVSASEEELEESDYSGAEDDESDRPSEDAEYFPQIYGILPSSDLRSSTISGLVPCPEPHSHSASSTSSASEHVEPSCALSNNAILTPVPRLLPPPLTNSVFPLNGDGHLQSISPLFSGLAVGIPNRGVGTVFTPEFSKLWSPREKFGRAEGSEYAIGTEADADIDID